MIQVVEQSRKQKLAMYMKTSKKELAEMLINCNNALDITIKNCNLHIVGGAERKYCEECKTWLPINLDGNHYCPDCGAIVPF